MGTKYVAALLRQRATAVWDILMAATATSWSLGTHHDTFIHERRIAAVAVVAIAFVKV